MVMVSVGTVAADRFLFRSGFRNAGWRWGKPKHYAIALVLPLFIWLAPTLTGIGLLGQEVPETFSVPNALQELAIMFLVTLIPAFGEEFGWRGYLLPQLSEKYTPRKAVILHGIIWWGWHLPFLAFTGWISGGISDNHIVSCIVVIAISFIPAVSHAVIFAWFRVVSMSLAVLVVYHAAFDEVRDAIEQTIGFNRLNEPWQMLSIIAIGGILLWKANWSSLCKDHSRSYPPKNSKAMQPLDIAQHIRVGRRKSSSQHHIHISNIHEK